LLDAAFLADTSADLADQSHAAFERGSGGTADALASGASWSNPVGVQIPASAPTQKSPSPRDLAAEKTARPPYPPACSATCCATVASLTRGHWRCTPGGTIAFEHK